MNEGSHGVALIINNIKWDLDKASKKPLMKTRDGAKKDAKDLKESLKAIGYHVIYKEDLTTTMMKQELEEVCDKEVCSANDSFICYISSHGGNDGVFGVDSCENCVSVDDLSKILEPDLCPDLKDKPKIFFVQACRGRSANVPIDDGNVDDEEEFVSLVPRRADFYFSYATDPDHVAVRRSYPQLLSKYLERSAQLSLDEIVMKVHEEIAREVHDLKKRGMHMQIGQVVHTMRGPVYFK